MERPTKEELVEQLKSLVNTETKAPKFYTQVSCYCMAPPPIKEFTCESCGKKKKIEDFWSSKEEDIRKCVQTIRELGFDAKVEHLCAHCATKLGFTTKDLGRADLEDGPLYEGIYYYVFYFKTKEQEEYNITISNDTNEYEIVVAFLRNQNEYSNTHRAYLIKDELELIKRMTGISID